jgi:glutathione S-transferase
MTIADYFGASFVTLGELIRGDFADYPNVERWLGNMKQLKNWNKVNEAIDGFAASLKDAQLQPL